MSLITPIILCGGSGTRLWPLSRKANPKQFSRLIGAQTLYQATIARLSGPDFAPPLVVTSLAYSQQVKNQVDEADLGPVRVMIEPSARNTAPAILAAALEIATTDPDALMLVAPSDHAIPNASAFRAAVNAGAIAAQTGNIVTFGIRPTRAETGYGWLELAADPMDFSPLPLPLKRFVEKPNASKAQAMLEAGTYLWNAGIFLASARTLIDAFTHLSPNLIAPVSAAIAEGERTPSMLSLAARPWAGAEDISIDYAVMERSKNLCVVPFAAGWSDLGDWDAIWRESTCDHMGIAATGKVTAIDCQDSLLRSETVGVELVGIGLTDMIVVAMQDAVLVAPRSRVQEVKEAVSKLKARSATQAEGFLSNDSNWSETRARGQRFACRSLQVAPQSELIVAAGEPKGRWLVLAGMALTGPLEDGQLVAPGGSFTNDCAEPLRIAAVGKETLVLVEMQIGEEVAESTQSKLLDLPVFKIAAE